MSNETILYLIERADAAHPGCVLPDHFLGKSKGIMTWLPRVDDALRFSSREEAELFIQVIMSLSDDMPLKLTIPGIRHGDIEPIVVEHSWS